MPNKIAMTVNYLFRPEIEIIGRQKINEFSAANRAVAGCKSITIHKDLKTRPAT